MFVAFASTIFIYVVSRWIQFELHKKVSLRKYWGWLFAAVIAAVVGSMLSAVVDGKLGNFLLHGIGGGVASTLMLMYLMHTFSLRLNYRVEAVVLFMFVSSLGILNELFEYVFESLGLGLMSLDSHDTWRDIVANTCGAFLAWLIIRRLDRIHTSKKAEV